MKHLLSFIKARWIGFLMLAFVLCVNIGMALQDAAPPVIVDTGFNAILLIPLFVGILAHWLKSYSRGQTSLNLWQYMIQGLGLTFTTFIGAVATLVGLVSASPGNYSPVNFIVLFNVFMIGFSWDSATGGTAIKNGTAKPPSP